MPRVKLSEFRAKKILFEALQDKYSGVSIDLKKGNYKQSLNQLPRSSSYAVKVDQAIKKRGKSGLVKLDRNKKQVLVDLSAFAAKGFSYALVEPFDNHKKEDERYISLTRTEQGVELRSSLSGGVDIEANPGSIKVSLLSEGELDSDHELPGFDVLAVTKLYELFQRTHMTLLEVNPYIVRNDKYLPLDAAVEVDSAAQFFVGGAWDHTDIRESSVRSNKSEQVVEKLNSNSPASLSLKILNPNGSIFLLLSGGGASVVVADELFHHGHHKNIANYGEYSGNPSEEDTYIYTKEILSLMNASKAHKKILIIAGGVANFTDVAKTFSGIIRAMRDMSADIKKQKTQVFVRRGGPNQARGLEAMRSFLEEAGVKSFVYGPERTLAEVVSQAAKAAA